MRIANYLILTLTVALTLTTLVTATATHLHLGGCLVKNEPILSHVSSVEPWEYTDFDDLPASFDWRNIDGVNYCSMTRNQHLPQYCGSCFVFAATSALNDRFAIMNKNSWPVIILSPQVVLNCGNAGNCTHGGSVDKVHEFIRTKGVPREFCQSYVAQDLNCSAIHTCMTCNPSSGCYVVPEDYYRKYYVEEHGAVQDEENMMAEIYHRGPIACGVMVTDEFEHYKDGIFQDKTGASGHDHFISIVGWGVDDESGDKYWIIRNSWGSMWGFDGFGKVIRGVNNIGIEKYCFWATPKQ